MWARRAISAVVTPAGNRAVWVDFSSTSRLARGAQREAPKYRADKSSLPDSTPLLEEAFRSLFGLHASFDRLRMGHFKV
jgi:hypothetical protein